MKAVRRKGTKFVLELPPSAEVCVYKGQMIVAHAEGEPFIVATPPKVIRYEKAMT